MDPPYLGEQRDPDIYSCENLEIAADVLHWAITHGDEPLLRIAICGLVGDYDDAMSANWQCVNWKRHARMAHFAKRDRTQAHKNAEGEVIWFSPHCLDPKRPRQLNLALEEEGVFEWQRKTKPL